MDARNHFETPKTFLLHRLEWAGALVVSSVLGLMHLGQIRWPVFIAFFVVIDLIGYIPGAIAFHRSTDGTIPRGYYVAYNLMHSLLTGAALVGLWALFVRPEWALLAVPIHLFGDRALFGNSLKSFGVRFEPAPHPAFVEFERRFAAAAGQRGEPAPGGEPLPGGEPVAAQANDRAGRQEVSDAVGA